LKFFSLVENYHPGDLSSSLTDGLLNNSFERNMGLFLWVKSMVFALLKLSHINGYHFIVVCDNSTWI